MESRRKALFESEIKLLMYQFLVGVKHLHDLQMFHRDFKTENILLSGHGKLKICDVGKCHKFGFLFSFSCLALCYFFYWSFSASPFVFYICCTEQATSGFVDLMTFQNEQWSLQTSFSSNMYQRQYHINNLCKFGTSSLLYKTLWR